MLWSVVYYTASVSWYNTKNQINFNVSVNRKRVKNGKVKIGFWRRIYQLHWNVHGRFNKWKECLFDIREASFLIWKGASDCFIELHQSTRFWDSRENYNRKSLECKRTKKTRRHDWSRFFVIVPFEARNKRQTFTVRIRSSAGYII